MYKAVQDVELITPKPTGDIRFYYSYDSTDQDPPACPWYAIQSLHIL
jgi:hypothetical protein